MPRAIKAKLEEEAVSVVSEEKKKKISPKILISFVILALIGGVGYSQYQLYRATNAEYQKQVAEERTQKVVQSVATLMELPEETPQVATVQDVDLLRQTQPFFGKAENGDLVLIYSQMAIIYSEKKNKIINVGPVNRDTPTPSEAVNTESAPVPEESKEEKEQDTESATETTKTTTDTSANTEEKN
jgi:hypothetical protein